MEMINPQDVIRRIKLFLNVNTTSVKTKKLDF
jgi:hypothetical protein